MTAGFWLAGTVGFHIVFANGWTVSVLWGPGNYADNRRMEVGVDDERAGREGSSTAECAVWGPDGAFVEWPGWDGVTSEYSTPAEVLELLNWAAAQPSEGDTTTGGPP